MDEVKTTAPPASDGRPTASPAVSGGPPGESALNRTEVMEAQFTPDASGPVSADEMLADAGRRRDIELRLAKAGMSPAEIRALLAANSNVSASASVPLPQPAKRGGRTPAPSATGLEAYAAELMAARAMATNRAVEKAAEQFPPFRESSAEERARAEALLREANALRRREKYADAEAKCKAAIELVPRDAPGLEMLGDIWQGVARVEDALAAYKRAMEADAKRASAEKKYGDLLMRQQNWGSVDGEQVPRNPYVAVFLSALMPGAGQFYNAETSKGFMFLLLDLLAVYLIAWSPFGLQGEHGRKGINVSLLACAVFSGVLYIAAMVDAMAGSRPRRRSTGGWDV